MSDQSQTDIRIQAINLAVVALRDSRPFAPEAHTGPDFAAEVLNAANRFATWIETGQVSA